MSFSSEVREELSGQIPKAKHCRAAMLRAILTMCGGVRISESDRVSVRIRTENAHVVRAFCEIVRKLIRRTCEVSVQKKPSGSMRYIAALVRHEDALDLLTAAGLSSLVRTLLDVNGMPDPQGMPEEETDAMPAAAAAGEADAMRECCARAYLKGCFLAAGSVSDPRRSYHLELVCSQMERAAQLQRLLERFSLDGRIVTRKGKYILYLKEADQIVTMLALMEASRSVLAFENVRILREITGDVNRRVNCETANINKTVEAAVRQIEDIHLIADTIGLGALPPALREIAAVRLENPDAPLTQLGQLLDPPVGKSGVNHRLRKLGEIAEGLR